MIKTLKPSIIISGIISGITLLQACGNVNEPRPNIILIISDDQGWGDAELSSNDIIDTPNMNTIGVNGARLERFYVNPMCAPTRASLMTGRYNLRTGTSWVGRRTDFLRLDETTMAEVFKSAGYATGCYGKWHIGAYGPYHPNERGFDDYTGILVGATRNYYNTDMNNNGKDYITHGYITDVLTDSALSFIDKNKNNPFFCYIPYNVPHHPFQVPQKYFDKYKNKGVEHDNTACVYGMIDNMDENIGRILDRLKKYDIEDNTIIIFMSDNGPAFNRFNDGLAGKKAEVSEGSVRVPFYIQWKNKIPSGQRIYDIAAHIDLFPTLLDAAGIQKPDSIEFDGISLLPLILNGENLAPDRAIYTHQTVFGKSLLVPGGLRTQKYRLLNWGKGYELYDMELDPSQKRNIAEQKPELLSQLIADYENWYSEVTADGLAKPPVPVGYPGFNPTRIIAPDALISENLKYSGRHGWVDDYVVNWTSTQDSVIWEIDVYSDGDYHFVLDYWCEVSNTGAELVLENEGTRLQGLVNEGSTIKQTEEDNRGMNSHPHRINWSQLDMGSMPLTKGRHELVLTASKIPGEYAAEVWALNITRKP